MFPCLCNNDDSENEMNELKFLSWVEVKVINLKRKIYLKIIDLEAEIKRLIEENRDQQKLLQQFDQDKCAYKKYIVTLKTQLKEGKKN